MSPRVCFTISTTADMMNTFLINVAVLDKTSKDFFKELTAKSFSVSGFFYCKEKL